MPLRSRHSQPRFRLGQFETFTLLSAIATFGMMLSFPAPPVSASEEAFSVAEKDGEVDERPDDTNDNSNNLMDATLAFRETVVPTLIENCLGCHSNESPAGGYSLETIEELFYAGDSTLDPVIAGNPKLSELFVRISTDNDLILMPEGGPKLDQETIESFRKWIHGGAPVPEQVEQSLVEFLSFREPEISAPENYPNPVGVGAIRVSPNGGTVFSSGHHEVLEWIPMEGKLKRRIPVSGRKIVAIDISSDQQWMVVSSGTPSQLGFIELIDLQQSDNSASRSRIDLAKDIPMDVRFNPDGDRILWGTSEGAIVVYNRNDSSIAFQSTPHASAVTSVAWSPDGTKFFSGSRDRMVKSFQSDDGGILATYSNHERVVGSVNILREGPVTYDETGKLRLFPQDDGNYVRTSRDRLPQYVQKAASTVSTLFVPEPHQIKSFGVDYPTIDAGKDEEGNPKKQTITVLSDRDGYKTFTDELPWSISVSEASEPTWIAAGFHDGSIMVWKSDSGPNPIATFLAKP